MTMFVSSQEISSSSLTSIPSEARDSLIALVSLICRYVVWWKKSTPAIEKYNSLIAHLCIHPCEHSKYKLESSVHYTLHLRYPMTTYLSHERHKILQMLTEFSLSNCSSRALLLQSVPIDMSWNAPETIVTILLTCHTPPTPFSAFQPLNAKSLRLN